MQSNLPQHLALQEKRNYNEFNELLTKNNEDIVLGGGVVNRRDRRESKSLILSSKNATGGLWHKQRQRAFEQFNSSIQSPTDMFPSPFNMLEVQGHKAFYGPRTQKAKDKVEKVADANEPANSANLGENSVFQRKSKSKAAQEHPLIKKKMADNAKPKMYASDYIKEYNQSNEGMPHPMRQSKFITTDAASSSIEGTMSNVNMNTQTM